MRKAKRALVLSLIVLFAALLAGCTVQEDKPGVYVEIAMEGVHTIGFQGEKKSGAVGNADGSALKEETIKLDFDIKAGETFELTASDENGVAARGTFTYEGGAMMVVLNEEGFAIKTEEE